MVRTDTLFSCHNAEKLGNKNSKWRGLIASVWCLLKREMVEARRVGDNYTKPGTRLRWRERACSGETSEIPFLRQRNITMAKEVRLSLIHI